MIIIYNVNFDQYEIYSIICSSASVYIVIVKYQATRIVCIIHREHRLHTLCGFLDCYNFPSAKTDMLQFTPKNGTTCPVSGQIVTL